MSYNVFPILNKGKNLVTRSTAPIYKGKFALNTDVTLFRRFEHLTATMLRAAESMPDAYFVHFKVTTDVPADTVRIVPSVLQSFNRSRVMRRACVSGIRMCNLAMTSANDWVYCSDMVVSCSFDAISICGGLADFSSLGNHICVTLSLPKNVLHNVEAVRRCADRYIARFWSSSRLARHSVFIRIDRQLGNTLVLEFEPKGISHISLLSYVLAAFADDLISVMIGRNNRLLVSKRPMWSQDDYLIYDADKIERCFRYKRAAAFGHYFNNPDYLLY